MPEKEMGVFTSFESALKQIKINHEKIKDYTIPWWGDKLTPSGNIINRGYVIGFKNEEYSAQWRLDFDPIKGLHINWSQEFRDGIETQKECYRIKSYVRSGSDTMFDYHVGWTKSRFYQIPPEIKGRLDSDGLTSWNGHNWERVYKKSTE